MQYLRDVLYPDSALEIDEPSVIFEEQDGEIVLVELRGGLYFRLKQPSAGVFKTLVSGHSLAKLQSACSTGGEAVEQIMSQLMEKHLVRQVRETRMDDPSPWGCDIFVLEEYGDLQEILKLDPIHEADPDAGWPTRRG